MENIFNAKTIESFKARINNLNENSTAKWGKMNLYQMLKHCTENEIMMVREQDYKRRFIGRLFGKMVLSGILKDDSNLKKNTPTHPKLIFKGDGSIEAQKQMWIAILEKYPTKQPQEYADFVHPFFGKMNADEISVFVWKHVDHHLRQFGA